ncbi:hypothetical protein Slin15195_G114340 [Septoria linicola]|uniref:Uncharacterized protein n=1 Tax=Septoria linicola TaxID=215465 RepID=A0A9Q9AZU4_9PEZI|nr:hypothetical protein Slin15195_G114340 [Septoria linicola]
MSGPQHQNQAAHPTIRISRKALEAIQNASTPEDIEADVAKQIFSELKAIFPGKKGSRGSSKDKPIDLEGGSSKEQAIDLDESPPANTPLRQGGPNAPIPQSRQASPRPSAPSKLQSDGQERTGHVTDDLLLALGVSLD